MALIWKCMSSVAFGYNDKQHLQCWITTSNPKNGRGMENEVGTPSRLRRYFQWLTFQQLVLVWHMFSYKWCSGPGLIWSSDRACHCPQWGPRGAGHRSCTTKNCTSRPFCRPLWARSRRPSLVAGFGVQACMMSIQTSACACDRVIVGVSLKHTSYFGTHCGFIVRFGLPQAFGKLSGQSDGNEFGSFSSFSSHHPGSCLCSRASPTSTKSNGCLCWQAVLCRFVTIISNGQPAHFLQSSI